ncbi:MAG: putative metal-binding motif-containing protein [Alphaproteobacteria bacterium]|nr:putative metal-binding motif-containing protein [Alphaproteobacteria bacterium]
MTDTVFDDNAGTRGGGLLFDNVQAGRLERGLFCANNAQGGFLQGYGGGVYLDGTSITSSGNVFVRNQAAQWGGGMQVHGGEHRHITAVGNDAGQGSAISGTYDDFLVVDSLFAQQVGGAALHEGVGASGTVESSWFYDNPGGDSTFALEASCFPDAADPQVLDLASALCDREPFRPLVGSGLVDAGTGPNDADGSPSDIGALGGPSWGLDGDADGVPAPDDCDDADPSVGRAGLRWVDGDTDGYGSTPFIGCPTAADAAVGADCDDTDPAVHPGAPELINGIDDDCDLSIDEDAQVWYADTDLDGYGDPMDVVIAAAAPAGYVADGTDCDDGDPAISPAAQEVCDPADVDEDCDGLADDLDGSVTGDTPWALDADRDGYGHPTLIVLACDQPPQGVLDTTDCDDTDPEVNPGAVELCDGSVDEDCDGLVDDADPDVVPLEWYVDADGDGSVGTLVLACAAPPGAGPVAEDCDDTDPLVSPTGTEVCGGGDEDCDGLVDDADPSVTGTTTFYADLDTDGYAGSPVLACLQPAGTSVTPDDCDDTDPDVSPAADELCDPDDVDEDCDGNADDLDDDAVGGVMRYADADGDGWGDPASGLVTCDGAGVLVADDCDDTNPGANPGAQEVCDANATDEDCDGLADDADPSVTGQVPRFPDVDGDGYGDGTATPTPSCAQGVLNTEDCDDTDPDVSPGAEEVWYDGVDQDCDGNDDDRDMDGYPGGTVGTDCDDLDPDRYPGAPEVPDDGIDQDCDDADLPWTYTNTCGCASGGGSALWLALPGLVALRRRARR